MAIEQTSQLIQLIMNSVLMAIACVILLSGLLVRHNTLGEGLRHLGQRYADGLSQADPIRGERLSELREQLYQLRYRHRAAHVSVMVVYYALWSFVGSTFALALRTLLPWNGLISLALLLFLGGAGILVIGVGLTLVDFHRARRSLSDELLAITGLKTTALKKAGITSNRPIPATVRVLSKPANGKLSGRSPGESRGESRGEMHREMYGRSRSLIRISPSLSAAAAGIATGPGIHNHPPQ
ncbi:MAG TPA: DUF2721 domain-containing protein [Chroococcidiopsis sp.]